jgi:tungstate transport system permease protein
VPPVVVGIALTILLWRTGPLGSLALLYKPAAMVLVQVLVALPLVAGFTRSALGLLDPDLVPAMRADGAGERRIGFELALAAWPQVLAVAAGFGRAIAEVGASLMVGQHRRADTHLDHRDRARNEQGRLRAAIALGIVLLLLAFIVNALLALVGVRGRVLW